MIVFIFEKLHEDWSDFHSDSSSEEVKHQPWGPNSEEDCLFFVQRDPY
ncbi:hypothetical protein [Halobacillus karajensis]|nr:hypothetical protein [Halobacillus karajensis]